MWFTELVKSFSALFTIPRILVALLVGSALLLLGGSITAIWMDKNVTLAGGLAGTGGVLFGFTAVAMIAYFSWTDV